jgi:hypothetical protein
MNAMQTKLTLRLDDELIDRAKSYAQQRGRSVSQLVADYFELLPGGAVEDEASLTPMVRSLLGVLRGAEIGEEDYRRYLEEKYL